MDEFIDRFKNTIVSRFHLWLLGYPLTLEVLGGYLLITGIALVIAIFIN